MAATNGQIEAIRPGVKFVIPPEDASKLRVEAMRRAQHRLVQTSNESSFDTLFKREVIKGIDLWALMHDELVPTE